MKRTAWITLMLLSLAPVTVAAQEGKEPGFSKYLYPPELVMQHQQRITLSSEQRTAITRAIQELQSKVVDLQWRMQEEAQQLTEMVQRPTVDEARVLEQVDRVLKMERDVKLAHMAMLLRIKNTLTREQQALLDSHR